MQIEKVYLDANILLDYLVGSRFKHEESDRVIEYCFARHFEIMTSCDIVTTIYYIDAKLGKQRALENIIKMNMFVKIINFSNKEVAQTCQLMKEDEDYVDLEDTLQYILAQKEKCDVIVSNDKGFVSKKIELLSSEAFIKKYISNQ